MRSKISPRTTVVASNVKAQADARKAVAAACQATADAAERRSAPAVRRVPAENTLDPADRASAVREVKLIEPTMTGKAIGVRLGSHRWIPPTGVDIALANGQGRDVAFVRGTGGRIMILVDTSTGIKELVADLAFVDEIRRNVFGSR